MDSKLFDIHWAGMLVPTGSLVEIVLRGTLMYLLLFGLLRIVPKRQSGRLNVTDVLVVVLIADAAQNAMAGEYRSIPEGVLLVATIIFWSYALDWLGYHFPAFERLVRPPPVPLIKDGKLMRRAMREEMVTMDELMTALHEQGVKGPGEVERACMEGDGRISIIKRGSG